MILRRPKPSEGVCFAWKWKHTSDGVVWLERVRFRNTDDGYRYERIKSAPPLAFPGGKLCLIIDANRDTSDTILIEIENMDGISHRVGEYKRRPDGSGSLEIDLAQELSRQAPLTGS